MSVVLLQIADVDQCAVYVSLAPGMENPAGMDLPEGDVARCLQYTSSEEDQNRPAPTTEDRVAGKRPLAVDPSPRRCCQRRVAKLQSVVGSSGSPMTTTRKRRSRPLWSESRAVVRTSRRPLAIGRLVTPLPLTPSRRVLGGQRRQQRPVGPGGGSLQQRIGAPICK